MKINDSCKENKSFKDGFSLIELVIAITILTIFVGGAALSFALLRSTDTKGLANGINNSLTDLKAVTEAHKGPFYLHIYKIDDKGYYACYDDSPVYTPPTDVVAGHMNLGSASLDVAVSYDGVESNEVMLSNDTSLSAYTQCVTILIQKKDGAYLSPSDAEGVPKYFVVMNGSDREYMVMLAKDTGLHYVHQV